MTSPRTVLIVEDDAVMRTTLAKHLGSSHRVLVGATCSEARALHAENRVDLVILDLHLPDGDGLALVEQFRRDDESEVVVVTAYPKIQSAVRALKAGALDYINKPFDLDEFDLVVQKALEHRRLRDEVVALRRERPSMGGVERILGHAPAIARVRQEIRQVAATPDTTVLVLGESGVGKDLIGEAVHQESARRKGSFVRVNASSIPATMIEAELFGHERGAFTDAKSSRRGLLEIADAGTLFLDEIGDLPLELQPKLLQVLETRRFRRVGGNRELEVNVRFVAATNRDLEGMVREGRFRGDLLYRLNVFPILVPPLRERREDVVFLARHFLDDASRRLGKALKGFSPSALARMDAYKWPGNVRELRNVVERAVILARDEVVNVHDLPAWEQPTSTPTPCPDGCVAFPGDLSALPRLEDVERRYILCVYRQAGNNKTRAAQVLGLSRVTLREKLRQYGIADEGGSNSTT
ncbi:MAG: sigma-54-dependent Fis family transcriptional regulator [Deltaproteobacteria bacterium]|nr:sigma-54-dependent Fis family transcriptional regulator [Deltaproteobacteria bacterium]